MTVIRHDPLALMNQLHSNLDRLFGSRAYDDATQTLADWTPAVDIKEEDERFVLRADVPGVRREDIEITMEDGNLTLRGKRETESRDERSGYRRTERVSGVFLRRFTLPDTADEGAITARCADGVLEVFIPKMARVQPRRIEIDAG